MVFAMPFQEAKFGNDPLDVVLLPYRMRRCVFPYPGVYAVQFVFDGEVLGDCPLRVR